MDLDKLKELEAKATPGELKSIALFGSDLDEDVEDSDIEATLTLVIDNGGGDLTATKMTGADEKLYIALRNSAKEMISTIERYKAENKILAEENKRQKDLLRKYRLGQS